MGGNVGFGVGRGDGPGEGMEVVASGVGGLVG